jgi:nitroimidazol reductase NimA-like FMN-containing flavoprotein (pyridoxamine 5'-phosphate oxidase superfamily)
MAFESTQNDGIERMDEDEIRGFLTSQSVGVLGLGGQEVPYLVPMSYGYDGERELFFTFVAGPESQKQALTEAATRARFLVYSAETAFNWESVMLTGAIDAVPAEEWDVLEGELQPAWRPDVLERSIAAGDVSVHRFTIEDQAGIKHTGLPPGFASETDAS